MKIVYRIIYFVVLPLAIIGLLYVNGRIAEDRYGSSDTNKSGVYKAEITPQIDNLTMKQDETKTFIVRVKNTGTMTWIPNEKNNISLSYHILNTKNEVVLAEGERTQLTSAVRSGDTIELNAKVFAPKEIGEYKVELDMIQEGITWFKAKGSKTVLINLSVEK